MLSLYRIVPTSITCRVFFGVFSLLFGALSPLFAFQSAQDTLCPTGVMYGGGELCRNGGDTTVLIRFTGTGPYQFVYSVAGVAQPAITTTNNPYVLRVRPLRGTVYKLESLRNQTCRQGSVSGSVFIGVYAPSTARLRGDYIFCNEADTTLLIDFTGTGPFKLTYAINGVLQKPIETFDDPFFLPVRTTKNQTYQLVSVASPGCIGLASGQSTISVLPTPTYANVQATCTGSFYQLSFDVLNAAPPLRLLSGNGSFSGNRFQSTLAAVGAPYNISFRDAVGCGNVTVRGTPNCNCTTQSGLVSATPLEVCSGEIARTTHNGQAQLSGGAVLRYVLHTNAGGTLGTVLGWSDQPAFALPRNGRTGVRYYISAVAGLPAANNAVDTQDPCLSISPGTPITFIEAPTASLPADLTVCPGTALKWPVTFTGTVPFELAYSINGVAQTPLTNVNTAQIDLLLSVNAATKVQIQRVRDAQCVTSLPDSATIAVFTSPVVTNLSAACEQQLTTYRVMFNASGKKPFVVDGLTGSFTGDKFVSTPVRAGVQYRATLTDSSRCVATAFSGLRSCACATSAGTMQRNPLRVCTGNSATATHNGNQQLEPNDALMFVLHTRADTVLGTVLATSASPMFALPATGAQVGTTYYISAVAGDRNAAGGVLLTDPCLSVSAGTPVTWAAPPTARVSGTYDICPGATRRFTVQLTGSAPYSLTYGLNSTPISVPVLNDTFPIVATHLEDATYRLISVSDAVCANGGQATGTVTFRVSRIPVIADSKVQCSPDGLSFAVSFRINEANAARVRVTGTVSGVVDTVTRTFTSQLMPVQTAYRFVVADLAGCGRDSVSGTGICPCETKVGTLPNAQPLVLCGNGPATIGAVSGSFLQVNDTLLYVLATQPSFPAGTIVAQSNRPSLLFNTATMQRGVTYYLLAVAGNKSSTGIDLRDPCLSVAVGPTVTFTAAPTARLSGNFTICPGETRRLRVDLQGGGPYSLTYALNGVPITVPVLVDSFIITATHLESATYSVTQVSGSSTCAGTASGTATITVRTPPKFSTPTVECTPEGLDYRVRLTIEANTLAGVRIASGQLDTVAKRFVSDLLPAGQRYRFIATSVCGSDTISGIGSCPCRTEAGRLGGTDLSLCYGQPATFAATTGRFLQRNDTLLYVLAAENLTPGGTIRILAQSGTPRFAYDSLNMRPDQTYYIFALAGDRSTAGVNLQDTCLSRSNVLRVQWKPRVRAFLTGNDTICNGQLAALRLRLEGGAPYNITLTANNSPLPFFSSTKDTLTRSVQPTATTIYRLQTVTANGCTATVGRDSVVVRVQPAPVAALSGDSTVCPNGNATLRIRLQGQAPFRVMYSVNGLPQPVQTTNASPFLVNVTNVQQAQTWRLVSVQDAICQGSVSGSADIGIRPSPTLNLEGDAGICPGKPAQLTIRLSNADSVRFTLTGDSLPRHFSNVRDAFQVTVSPKQTTTYQITNVQASGNICTPIVGKATATVRITPLRVSARLSDYNGVNVRCKGGRDGSVRLSVLEGTAPYRFQWSTGQDSAFIGNLGVGVYMFTVTDQQGCSATESVQIEEPDTLSTLFDVLPGTCRNPLNGALIINDIDGGTPPYVLTIGNRPSEAATDFPFVASNLVSGTYTFTIKDGNGCTLSDRAVIAPPPNILVELGPDIYLSLGDSVALQPLVQGQNIQSFRWTPDTFATTPNALSTVVRPLYTIRYKLTVRDTAGCVGTDEVAVVVARTNRLYAPNIFRPGSTNGNEWFQLFGGPEVQNIRYVQIFTRWGEKVFEAQNFRAGDLSAAWDGRFRNRDLPPGVYVYKAFVEYINGTTDTVEGDVMLVR